jgi:hypothetical protein
LAPPNCGGLNSAHIHGTHVPVEEPSTTSEAEDIHDREHCRRRKTNLALNRFAVVAEFSELVFA